MTLKDMLFSFEGRLRRRDYWILTIVLGLLQFVGAQALIYALVGREATIFSFPNTFNPHHWTPAVGVMIAAALVFLWPFMALMAKRRHDRDASAVPFIILQLTWIAVAYAPLDLVISAPAARTVAGGMIALASFGMSIWFLVVLGILDGTPGPNTYGPSPKGVGDVDGVFD